MITGDGSKTNENSIHHLITEHGLRLRAFKEEGKLIKLPFFVYVERHSAFKAAANLALGSDRTEGLTTCRAGDLTTVSCHLLQLKSVTQKASIQLPQCYWAE